MKTHALIVSALSFVATAACAATLDTNRIEQITGLKGAWNAAEGVPRWFTRRDCGGRVVAACLQVCLKPRRRRGRLGEGREPHGEVVSTSTTITKMSTLDTLLLITALTITTARAQDVNFDDAKLGEPPAGWTATKTGSGTPKWTVVKDDTVPSKPNVLKQSGEADYPVAFKNDTSLKDGFVEVKFKPVSGKEDQAGGVVWRAKDADNYYIARANALEDNVRIYHFVKGKRTQFKGASEKVAPGQWHTLRVNFSGNRFTFLFNDKELFTAEDETFKEAGKASVWTKADSVTLFDDFNCGSK